MFYIVVAVKMDTIAVMAKKRLHLRTNESGQAVTEYVIALAAVIIIVVGIEILGQRTVGTGPFEALVEALGDFILNLLRLICLPFP